MYTILHNSTQTHTRTISPSFQASSLRGPRPAALKEFNGEIFALPSDPGGNGSVLPSGND